MKITTTKIVATTTILLNVWIGEDNRTFVTFSESGLYQFSFHHNSRKKLINLKNKDIFIPVMLEPLYFSIRPTSKPDYTFKLSLKSYRKLIRKRRFK